MKRFLLLILSCGMYATTFAQSEISKNNNSEVSDKWVITPIPTLKGVLGRLDINFPADIERTILIYQQSDNKFLTSVSRNDKIYPIAPGEYRFAMTNVPIDNVPIKKGHETRLKAGFLDIVSEGGWNLYDETKEKAYTSGNKPKKLALPVGRYQIKLGGQFYPVIIKDGETVEDSSPAEDETPIPEKVPIMETDAWIITPMKIEVNTTFKGMGRLDLNFGAAVWGQNGINIWGYTNPSNKRIYDSDGLVFYNLSPGEYKFSLNNLSVDFPIRQGYETKIKHGFLEVLTECTYRLGSNSAALSQNGKKRYVYLPGAIIDFYIGNSGGLIHGRQSFTIQSGITDSTKFGIVNFTTGSWNVKVLGGDGSICASSSSGNRSVVLAIGKYILHNYNNSFGNTYTVEIKAGDTITY